MSRRKMWKMLHLIHLYGRRKGDRRILTERQLIDAGVDCDTDSWYPLEQGGAVIRTNDEYELSPAALKVLEICVVAKGPEADVEIRVDYPEVFVIMPFGELWSESVWQMFVAGIDDAGKGDSRFEVVRGDTVVRVGDLNTNVLKSIARAGLIIAEVSKPNPNVFYEVGLADALGKDVYLFKQADAALAADFGGAHWFEYEISDLARARRQVGDAVAAWAEQKERSAFNVKALEAV